MDGGRHRPQGFGYYVERPESPPTATAGFGPVVRSWTRRETRVRSTRPLRADPPTASRSRHPTTHTLFSQRTERRLMTTWADLFERAAAADADHETIRETLDRQRRDETESDDA